MRSFPSFREPRPSGVGGVNTPPYLFKFRRHPSSDDLRNMANPRSTRTFLCSNLVAQSTLCLRSSCAMLYNDRSARITPRNIQIVREKTSYEGENSPSWFSLIPVPLCPNISRAIYLREFSRLTLEAASGRPVNSTEQIISGTNGQDTTFL